MRWSALSFRWVTRQRPKSFFITVVPIPEPSPIPSCGVDPLFTWPRLILRIHHPPRSAIASASASASSPLFPSSTSHRPLAPALRLGSSSHGPLLCLVVPFLLLVQLLRLFFAHRPEGRRFAEHRGPDGGRLLDVLVCVVAFAISIPISVPTATTPKDLVVPRALVSRMWLDTVAAGSRTSYAPSFGF